MKKVIFALSIVSVSMASYAQKPVPKAPPPPPVEQPLAVEPPPPPPPVRDFSNEEENILPTYISEKQFLKNNPSVKSVHWKMGAQQMIIKLKNGKTEQYDLSDSNEIAEAQKRYGALPIAPPPPPPALPKHNY